MKINFIILIIILNLYNFKDTKNNGYIINNKKRIKKTNIIGFKSIRKLNNENDDKNKLKIKVSQLNLNNKKNITNDKKKDPVELKKIVAFKKINPFSIPFLKNLFNINHFKNEPFFKKHLQKYGNRKVKKFFVINDMNHPRFNEFNTFLPKLRYLFFRKRFKPLNLVKIRLLRSRKKLRKPHFTRRSLFNFPLFYSSFIPNEKKIFLKPFNINHFNSNKHHIHSFEIRESYTQTNNEKPKRKIEVKTDNNYFKINNDDLNDNFFNMD